MKTVFKKGMKVYDQLVFPDKEGKVISVVESDDFPIKVHHEGLDENISYTEDGRYYLDIEPTLSTKDYTLQGFEQKAPVPEFYEALGWLENNKNYKTVIRDERTYPSMEIYKAFEALRKLIILRDFYNEGWQPDWDDDTVKHTIETCCNDEFVIEPSSTNYPRVLSFKSKKIRNRFFEEQKELLEIAKPLL
jgi:hypothetical protein